MPSDSSVRIKILWDDIAAKREIINFQGINAQAQKQIATDAKISAQATLSQAQAFQFLERAALATARAQLAGAQADQASARASKITTDTLTAETVARNRLTKAAEAQAVAAARARVSGENRQFRDENLAIRQGQQTHEARLGMASQAADGAMLTGALTIGAMAYAGEQAGKFETAMTKMRNQTQMSDKEFDTFRAHIMEVGKATGASMDEMAAAFMRAKNHGLDLKTSMAVVDAATKSALATGANIEETANVLAQTMHIFHINGDQAVQTMNTLHQAQLQGNTTMSQFVENFGLAEAVTSKYGLTLQDTAAITATMTENGLNMAESGTQIRSVMQHLTAATAPARQEIEKLSKRTGIDLVGDIKKLQAGTGSLSKTMIDLSAATGGSAVEINKIIPAQRGAFGAMALTGKASIDLKKNFDELGETVSGKLDPSTEGFNRQQKTLQAQTARLNNEFQILYVKLGTTLIPVLESGAQALIKVVDAFNRLSPEAQSAIGYTALVGGGLLLVAGGAAKATIGVLNLVNGLRLAGITFGGVATAAEVATGAETTMATSGALLLGTGGIYVAAIAVAVIAIGSIVVGWNQAKDATNQAAEAARNYAKMKTDVASQGELGKLNVGERDIAEARSNLKDQIDEQKAQDMLIAKAKSRGDNLEVSNLTGEMQGNPEKFGDVAAGGMLRMVNRLTHLNADYDTEKAREKQLVREGAGASNRAMIATGADGFAKSVLAVSPDRVVTTVSESCAQFVSKVFIQAGLKIPEIVNARALRDKIVNMGGKEHGGPSLPGDLVYFDGPAFTRRRDGSNGSGHVGYATGDGGIEESSRGVTKRSTITGDLAWAAKHGGGSAHFITVPGSTFANPGGAASASGISKYSGGTFDGDDKGTKDRAAVLVEKAGLQADDAKRAYEKAATLFEQTHSLTYLAAAQSLRRAQFDREIAEAKASESKAMTAKDANGPEQTLAFERKRADILASRDADLRKLDEKASGTPEQRRKAAADLAMALLDRKVTAANQAVQKLEALAQASNDPTVLGSLQQAYNAQANSQLEALRAGLKSELGEIAPTRGNAALRLSLTTKEQNEELAVSEQKQANLASLDQRRAEQQERLVTAMKDALAAQQGITAAALSAALTEEARKPLRDAMNRQKLQELDLDRQASQARINAQFDPLAERASTTVARDGVLAQKRAAAQRVNDQYNASVTAAGLDAGAGNLSAANEQITQRADRLRTEAGLTDNLTAKMDKLAQAFDLLIGIEPDKATADLMRRQKQDEQDRLGLQRDSQNAQTGIARGILGGDPAKISAGLDALKALASDSRANLEEQKQARALYQTTVGDLAADKQLGGRDAIGRILAQKGMTAPEIASAIAAAKHILDSLVEDRLQDIGQMRHPSDRKKALKGLDTDLKTDPLYQIDGIGKAAQVKVGDALKSGGGNKAAADQFFAEFASGASRAAPEIISILFHPKKHQNIMKTFWGSFANAGESAISSLLDKTMQSGITSLLGGLIPGGSFLGKLLHFSEGGFVPGSGAGDIVPAMLTPGEFVMSRAMIKNMSVGPGMTGSLAGGVAGVVQNALAQASTKNSGQVPQINVTTHNHQPVFHSDVDLDRQNDRQARQLQKSFLIG